MAKILIISIVLIILSCSGISTLNKIDRSKLYSSEFLETVSLINKLIEQKQLNKAQAQLTSLDESSLSSNEISLKRYLLGRIYLGIEDTEKAILNFELALSGAGEDKILTSQSFLGLAFGYYKIGIYDRSLENLKQLNLEYLTAAEKINNYNIGYQISKAYQNQELYEKSLIGLVSMLGSNAIQNDPYFQELYSLLILKSLDDQRTSALNFISMKNYALINMALKLSQNLIFSGRNQDAIYLVDEIQKSDFGLNFTQQINDIKNKLTDEKKISPLKIGIILPLSGKYKKYGVEALSGIQIAYEKFLRERGFILSIKDTKSSPIISSFYAKELSEKDHVGLIIGGLSSGEAKSIFLEIRNKQIPFISLAQVFLPRHLKDQFLIEMPPSIESEVEELVKPENIEKLGKKAAIIFPMDEAGKYYFSELFTKQSENFSLVDAINYNADEQDFSDPIKTLLNLKHVKLRAKEFNMMKEYFEASESSSVRRVQTLSPKINFDWVFIPSRPLEALQLIPSFNYYDAFNTLMVGPSSWNNLKIRQLGAKNRKLHFLDEIVSSDENELKNSYTKFYFREPNVISERGMDALSVANKIIGNTETNNRNEFLSLLNQSNEIEINGQRWDLTQGLWIKKVSIHHLSRGLPREGVNN